VEGGGVGGVGGFQFKHAKVYLVNLLRCGFFSFSFSLVIPSFSFPSFSFPPKGYLIVFWRQKNVY